MNRIVLVFLLTACVAFGGTGVISGNPGTKCATPKFKVEYDNSRAVFVGEVIEDRKEGNTRYFVFKVRKFWKGVKSETIEVSVNENRRFQAPFKMGKTFLVFAKANNEDGLYDGRCSHSAGIGGYSSTLKDDLEKLGKAKTCIDLTEKVGNEVEKEKH